MENNENKIIIRTYTPTAWGWTLSQELTFLKNEVLKKFTDAGISAHDAEKVLNILTSGKPELCPMCKSETAYKGVYDGLDTYICPKCGLKIQKLQGAAK